VEPASSSDSIRLTLAHVALNRRHALRDLGRIIGADVDVSYDIGGGADGRHVDPKAKVWIEGDDAERAGPKLTLDIVVTLARSVRPTGVARPLAIERVEAEAAVTQRVRSGFDGWEVQAHGLEELGRELGLLGAILDDHGTGRRTDPCRPGSLVDRFSRPCAPALRDRAPVAASAQMLEFEDVATTGAAGEAAEAAVTAEA
jgi:hypothetical protein